MSEVKKRKVHNAEFKAKVGMEAVRGVKTLNEIGQQYGVHPGVVSENGKNRTVRTSICLSQTMVCEKPCREGGERRCGRVILENRSRFAKRRTASFEKVKRF